MNVSDTMVCLSLKIESQVVSERVSFVSRQLGTMAFQGRRKDQKTAHRRPWKAIVPTLDDILGAFFMTRTFKYPDPKRSDKVARANSCIGALFFMNPCHNSSSLGQLHRESGLLISSVWPSGYAARVSDLDVSPSALSNLDFRVAAFAGVHALACIFSLKAVLQ